MWIQAFSIYGHNSWSYDRSCSLTLKEPRTVSTQEAGKCSLFFLPLWHREDDRKVWNWCQCQYTVSAQHLIRWPLLTLFLLLPFCLWWLFLSAHPSSPGHSSTFKFFLFLCSHLVIALPDATIMGEFPLQQLTLNELKKGTWLLQLYSSCARRYQRHWNGNPWWIRLVGAPVP